MRAAWIGTASVGVLAGVVMNVTVASAADLPAVAANDNRRPAGVQDGAVRRVVLRAARGVWTPEGEGGPTVEIEALGERDGVLQVPAPLLRVVEGATLAVSVTNDLVTPLVVHGLCEPGPSACPPLTVPPAATREVAFASGPAGTYHYWASAIGAPVPFREMGGAFVVDPLGAVVDDRVMVITEWSSLTPAQLLDVVRADDSGAAFVALRPEVGFMVNGRAWPATERLRARVGETERWRIVNLSSQPHPMHLHGFSFDVVAGGDGRRDRPVAAEARHPVVTHLLPPAGTMAMTWTPSRTGRWLFHCHLMDHVAPERRVGGVPRDAHGHDAHAAHDSGDAALGMAGLVMGIEVAPARDARADDATARRDPRPRRRLAMDLWSNRLHGEPPTRFGVTIGDADGDHLAEPSSPGPPLVLTRGEPVEILVRNHLEEPTAIHWHGMELESVYDGVHGWSGDCGQRAPMIAPGETFVVRFTPPSAGTFIYHTHLHDHRQLSLGLYGAMVVVEPATPFDPATDHALVLGRRNLEGGPLRLPDASSPVVLNGATAPRFVWRTATRHRLRLVNISADDILVVTLQGPRGPVTWRPLAKDGADLPVEQRVAGVAPLTLATGETADMELELPASRAGLWIEVRTSTGQWAVQAEVLVR